MGITGRWSRIGAAMLAGVLTLAACTRLTAEDMWDVDWPSDAAMAAAQEVPDGVHVNNPYATASFYVNEVWAEQVLDTAALYANSDPTVADGMTTIAEESTGVWLDSIAAIEGDGDAPGIRDHLDAAFHQREGRRPIVLTVVIHDLPGRNCASGLAGELPATEEGLERYRSEYIDPLAAMFAEDKYQGVRIVAVIEPGSLTSLAAFDDDPDCQAAAPYYRQGITYALDAFAPLGNVYAYLDAGSASTIGTSADADAAVALLAQEVGATDAGYDSIDGFAVNVAGYTPLKEPYIDLQGPAEATTPLSTRTFWGIDGWFDDVDWTADLYAMAVDAGFPDSIGMVIDTSRNGWGGISRVAAEAGYEAHEVWDERRVDRRSDRSAWCNQERAGLGPKPIDIPYDYVESEDSHVDALMWVMPPGESDGSAVEDVMCEAGYGSDELREGVTGALADAPAAGEWFPALLASLVEHAYPGASVPKNAGLRDPMAGLPVNPEDGLLTFDDGAAGDGGEPSELALEVRAWAVARIEGSRCAVRSYLVLSGGKEFDVRVDVTAVDPLESWKVSFTYPDDVEIVSVDYADQTVGDGELEARSLRYGGALAEGESTTFSLTATGSYEDWDIVACEGTAAVSEGDS